MKVTIASAVPVMWEVTLSCGHVYTGGDEDHRVVGWELEQLQKQGYDCFYCNPKPTKEDLLVRARERKKAAEDEVARLEAEIREMNLCTTATQRQGDPHE